MASKEETLPTSFPDSTKNSFSCDECKKVLPNMARLKCHKQTHANPESVTCNICKKVFAFPASLVRHQSVHTGIRPYKCPVCTMAFTQDSHMKRHMKLVHKIENSNSAKTSNKQNPKKGFGKMEKNCSSGNKQKSKKGLRKTGIEYECDVCGSSFKKAKTLKVHKRKHTLRENMLVCKICGKGFKSFSQLATHKRQHTKPPTCNICKKSFANASYLSQHEMIHSGEWPYPCDLCGKKFRQKGHVKQHKKTAHLQERYCESRSKILGENELTFANQKELPIAARLDENVNQMDCISPAKENPIFGGKEVLFANQKVQPIYTKLDENGNQMEQLSADKENPISRKSEVTLYPNKKQQKMSPASVGCKQSSDDHQDQLGQVNRESATCEISENSFKVAHDNGPESVSEKSENFVPDNGNKLININLDNGNTSVNPSLKLSNANQQIPAKPKVRPNQCDICFKTFKQKSYVKDHKRTHTGEKPFSCECGKRYTFKHRLRSHLESGNCEIKRAERSDEKPKKMQRQLREEKISNSETKTFQCQFCSKKFKTKGHVDMHERVHTGHRPYHCNLCGKSFKQSGHVMIHKRGVHSKGRRVKSERNLKSTKNMGIPTSESPQKRRSSAQGNSVSTKNLGSSAAESPQKRKMSSPNKNLKVYKCEFCVKTFKQENQLLLHKRMHELKSGPFECQSCGKSFKIRNNLYRHELVHTGEKPYICEICGKSCSQKSNLKSHVTRVHRVMDLETKFGEFGSEVVSSSSQIYGVQTEVSHVDDSTMNAYKESDNLTNSEELQSKAECLTSQPCHKVQKDSNCTNKSAELLHLREKDSGVTPPSPRVNKERNLFTELKLRKRYYGKVSSTAEDENISNSNKNSSEVSDLNNNERKSKASDFEEDNLSGKPYTEIVSRKDKLSANLHSESVGHREQRFRQKSEESSLQGNNSIAKNESPFTGIETEEKINSTRSCNESANNFADTNKGDIHLGMFEDISQEKVEECQLNREAGGGNENMFLCCECGERFDEENSMRMHCVDVH